MDIPLYEHTMFYLSTYQLMGHCFELHVCDLLPKFICYRSNPQRDG